MITYIYTPVSGAQKTVTLIDSDRFWPHPFSFSPTGELQATAPVRSLSGGRIGRGLVIVSLDFTAHRVFASNFLAIKHAAIDVPAMCGTTGTLIIEPPGGRIRWLNCGCRSAPARNLGVSVMVECHFDGPQLTLG